MPLFNLRRNRRWGWVLRVAGLRHVYHSGPGIPSGALPDVWTEDGPSWVPVQAITSVGALSERLPVLGGVVEQSPISITLASRGDQPAGDGDPAAVFARLGVRSAGWWGQMLGVNAGGGDDLAVLLPDQDPPFVVYVDTDPTELDYPRVVHIGQEAFIASAGAGVAIGGGNPWRLTISDRAIGETIARKHETQGAVQDYPIVTSPEPVFWRSRRAVLVGYEILPGGSIGEWAEVARGMIERTPQVSDDGLSVTIELSPLTALLSQEAQIPRATTRMVRGLHLYERGNGDVYWMGESLARPWAGVVTDAAAAGAGVFEVEADTREAYAALFDHTLADPLNPRAGTLLLTVGGVDHLMPVDDVIAVPPQLVLEDGDDPPRPFTAGAISARWEVAWRKAQLIDEGPQILRFPGDADDPDFSVLGIIHDRLSVDDHLGEDGGWVSPFFTEDGIALTGTVQTALSFYLFDGPAFAPGTVSPSPYGTPLGGSSILWYPIPLGYAIEEGRTPFATPGGGQVVRYEVNNGEGRFRYQGMPLCYYQQGERWILVEDPLDVSSGTIRVTAPQDPYGNSPSGTIRVAPSAQEVVVPAIGSDLDGESVWAIQVLEPGSVPSFGEWDDVDVVDIRVDSFTYETSGELLAHLLSSPDHLGLGTDDLDLNSILGDGADPMWATRWGLPDTDEALTYADVIGGILRVTRSALVMRTDAQGRCRLTRVPVGAEAPGRVAVNIAQRDWAAGKVPSWGTDDLIVNRLTLRADFGVVSAPDEDREYDWRYERTFESRTSQRLFEEVAGEDVDVYALLNLDRGSPAIEATARSAIALYETPRRTWTGQIGSHLGVLAHLGSTVSVTSRHLRGYTTDPVIGGLGVVVERSLDLWGEGAALTLVHNGRLASGWHASLYVTAVVNPTTVTVSANAYSSPDTPTDVAPYQDIDILAVGDVWFCVPALDQAGSVEREVSAVDRVLNRVTFGAAHGLAVGDVIIPADYDTSASRLLVWAYQGDTNGRLGAAEVAAPVYE